MNSKQQLCFDIYQDALKKDKQLCVITETGTFIGFPFVGNPIADVEDYIYLTDAKLMWGSLSVFLESVAVFLDHIVGISIVDVTQYTST